MNKKLLYLSVALVLILLAIVNSEIAKKNPTSWSQENLNMFNQLCLGASLVSAIFLLCNAGKKISLWVIGIIIVLFDLIVLSLSSIVTNFGF
jgi:hypothetical protein